MEMTNRALYAKHRGITEGAVRKALASGRITANAKRQDRCRGADKQWEANTRTAGGSDDTAASSYKQSRAIREAYNAKMAKLEFEKESGKLIDLAEAKVDFFQCWQSNQRQDFSCG